MLLIILVFVLSFIVQIEQLMFQNNQFFLQTGSQLEPFAYLVWEMTKYLTGSSARVPAVRLWGRRV